MKVATFVSDIQWIYSCFYPTSRSYTGAANPVTSEIAVKGSCSILCFLSEKQQGDGNKAKNVFLNKIKI